MGGIFKGGWAIIRLVQLDSSWQAITMHLARSTNPKLPSLKGRKNLKQKSIPTFPFPFANGQLPYKPRLEI